VGDQNRVEKTQFFDSIEFSTQREFKTQTDYSKARELCHVNRNRPDNIDIVINELDALVNIDLETRKPKKR
jgi:uridine phosphorylase